MKSLLINYFKFCLSRSNYYELNINLVRDHPIIPTQAINNTNSKFLNLSNSGLEKLD